METFYLRIEVIKSETELMNGQSEILDLEFDTAQEVRDSARGICNMLFYNRPAKAYLIINRHSTEGNEPCDKILIYEQ